MIKSFRYILLSAIFFAGFLIRAKAKEILYEDHVYESHIHSVQFYKGDDPLSYPVLYLWQPDAYLTLEFDELISAHAPFSDFWASIELCDVDWTPSTLVQLDYLEGYPMERLTDYRQSINTLVPFVHYTYQFPGEFSKIKRSGNYLLKIFRNQDEQQIVITRRFVVADNKIRVVTETGKTNQIAQRARLQTIQFDLYPQGLQIFDPYNDIKVKVLQNGRWDNVVEGLRPQYMTADKYTYRFDAAAEFSGGNEFRMADFRSTRFFSRQVDKIIPGDSFYTVHLRPEQPRALTRYFTQEDFNGKYWIEVQEYPEDATMADYVVVKFILEVPEPIYAGGIFVFGALSDWKCKPAFEMWYNEPRMRYETDVLLKQGIYNYEYVVMDESTGKADENSLEGSYYETENDYMVLVYYKGPMDRAYQVSGISMVNYYDDP